MRKNGFSLVELIIACAIGGVLLLAAFYMLSSMMQSQITMHTNLSNLIDISTLRLKLGREVGGAQMRSFIFTGNGTVESGETCAGCSPGNDRMLARFVVPLAGKCRDLSSCPESIALLFSSQRNRRPKPIEAICFVDDKRLLVRDAVPVADIITLVGPPNSTLWRVQAQATSFAVAANGAPLSSDCINTLNEVYGSVPPGPYYTITVAPVVGEPFTGGACVCESHIRKAVNFFPSPIVDIEIFSLGLLPRGDAFEWGLNACALAGNGRTLDCSSGTGFTVPGVKSFEIHEELALNESASKAAQWFALTPEGQSPNTANCAAPDCLPMALPAQLRSILPNETMEELDLSKLSLVKQEMLRRLRFFIRREDARTYSAEIQF